MADMGSMYATLGIRLKGIAEAQKTMQNMLRSVQREADRTRSRLQALETQAKSTGDKTKNTFRGMPAAIAPVTKSIDQLSASIFASAQRWRTFGYLASIVLTAPMVMAGKAALKTASDFEYAMNKVVGLVGMPREEMEKFKQEIIKMGPEVGQSIQALAEAFYYITSAGFKEGTEAMKILGTAAKMSTAGMGEAADIAKLLVFSMNAYKKEGLTSTRAADVFTAAVREGAIEADGFSTAMQSVLPIASAMGLGIEQVAGSMAAMSLQGASAANAATYLKGMLNSLLKIKPGSGAAKALKEFGVTAEDLYATLKQEGGLLKVLVQLQDLSNRTTGNMFLKSIFRDIRGMTGALSLVGQNLEYNDKVMKSVAAANGDYGRSFSAVAQGMDKRIKSMKSTMETIRNTFGESFGQIMLPVLEFLVKILKSIVTWFDNLSDGLKKSIVYAGALVAAIGPLALLGSVLKYAYGGFFMTFIKWIRASRLAVKGLTGDLVAMETAAKTAPWITNSIKAFAAYKLAVGGWKGVMLGATKTLANFGRVALGSGIGALAAGIAFGTIKIIKFHKEAKRAYQESDIFNTTMIKVNDTMKKFNEITSEDIGMMTLDEMTQNQEKARKVWEQAYRMYNQFQENKKMANQSDRVNNKLAKEQLENLNFAKKAYEDIGTAITAYKKRMEEARKAAIALQAEEDAEEVVTYNNELQAIWNDMMDAMAGLQTMATINKDLGKPFDLADEQAKKLTSTLETLVGEKWKLTIEHPMIKSLIVWLKELGIDFTEVGQASSKFMNELNADLAAIDMKKLILGPDFDRNTAKLDVYTKAVDQYINILTTPIDSSGLILTPTPDQLKKLDELIGGMNKYSKVVQDAVDKETLDILNAEANAFGNLAGKIEVVRYKLQAAERDLRALFLKKNKGLVSEEEIQNAIRNIQKLQTAMIDLEAKSEMTHLQNMNDVMGTASSASDLLSGYMSVLDSKLRYLSDTGKGATMQFKILAEELRSMQWLDKGIGMLTDTFDGFVDIIIEGGDETQTLGEKLDKFILQTLKDIVAEMIKAAAKALILQAAMSRIKGTNMDVGASLMESIEGGIKMLMEGFNKKNTIPIPGLIAPTQNIGGIGEKANISSLSGITGIANLFKPKEIENTTKALEGLTNATDTYNGIIGGTPALMEGVAKATKMLGTAQAASTMATKAVTAVDAASIPVKEASATASFTEAGASMMKGAAKIPFPLNMLAIAASVALVLGSIAAIMAASKMAKGGEIPPGYPNDTFPAWLTSGETVIPKGGMSALLENSFNNILPLDKIKTKEPEFEGVVRFEIEGDRLVGILKKQGKKLSIY